MSFTELLAASDAELVKIRDHYEELARRARAAIRSGRSDTGIPRVSLDWETGETAPEDAGEEEGTGKG